MKLYEIRLILQVRNNEGNPKKWNWQELTDHHSEIYVMESKVLADNSEDDEKE